jgi:hypothetical protein
MKCDKDERGSNAKGDMRLGDARKLAEKWMNNGTNILGQQQMTAGKKSERMENDRWIALIITAGQPWSWACRVPGLRLMRIFQHRELLSWTVLIYTSESHLLQYN